MLPGYVLSRHLEHPAAERRRRDFIHDALELGASVVVVRRTGRRNGKPWSMTAEQPSSSSDDTRRTLA
jgi:hypothetical protein